MFSKWILNRNGYVWMYLFFRISCYISNYKYYRTFSSLTTTFKKVLTFQTIISNKSSYKTLTFRCDQIFPLPIFPLYLKSFLSDSTFNILVIYSRELRTPPKADFWPKPWKQEFFYVWKNVKIIWVSYDENQKIHFSGNFHTKVSIFWGFC